jgi:NADPH-dependent ferric siderophore reductase
MSQQFGTVHAVGRLSPSMVRIVFGGPGLDDFEPTESTDQYVAARFVPDGAPYDVPFDDADLDGLDAALRPRSRRYTVRRWDAEKRLLTIDFVTHGDVGYAGRWAERAQVGDRLQMSNPRGGYRPDPNADWHLMVGDESALPAIAASLDVLEPGAQAIVIVVVDRPENEMPIESPASVDVRWLHRCTATDPESLLVDEVRGLAWPGGTVDVFVHGEAAEVRSVRRHLLADRGVDKQEASISPYWRRGRTDEAWRDIKRQWMAEQANDV